MQPPGTSMRVLAHIQKTTNVPLEELYGNPEVMNFVQNASGHRGMTIIVNGWTFISAEGSGRLLYHDGSQPAKPFPD